MARIYVVRTIHGLSAAFDADKQHLAKLKLGEVYRAEIKQPRNLAFHCKYFALVNLVFSNLPEHLQDTIRTPEELHTEIKMQTGIRMKRISLSGKEYFVPGSIAFAKMDEAEFSEFYSLAVDVIIKFILPGVDRAELWSEVESYL